MPFTNLKYNQKLTEKDAEIFSVDLTSKDCPKLSVVDQFDAQPFMRGENGFNRNIISQIMAAESMDLKQMLLQKLGDLSKAPGFDPSTPVQDVLDSVVPRNVQTSSSMRDWLSVHDKSIGKYVDGLKAEFERQQALLNPPKDETQAVDSES